MKVLSLVRTFSGASTANWMNTVAFSTGTCWWLSASIARAASLTFLNTTKQNRCKRVHDNKQQSKSFHPISPDFG